MHVCMHVYMYVCMYVCIILLLLVLTYMHFTYDYNTYCRCAVSVGMTTMSGSEMIANNMKGKGVTILHCYGDHLWYVHCIA